MEKNMIQIEEKSLNIITDIDKSFAKKALLEICSKMNIHEKDINKLIICTKEISSNIIKHSEGGTLTIVLMSEDNDFLLKIISSNKVKPSFDFEECFKDGFSTTDSLGIGFSILNEFMDEINYEINNSILLLTFTKKFEAREETRIVNPLDIGAATRPHPRMKINGDAIFFKTWSNYSMVSIIDGLGHGQYAARASQNAKIYLENHYNQSLLNIFLGLGRACRSTRGCVASVLIIDVLKNTLEYAGVGNITTLFFGLRSNPRFINKRGILGVKNVIPLVQTGAWEPNAVMIMYSDGISNSAFQRNLPDYYSRSASEVANDILINYSKKEDDASVIVVKAEKNVK
jgi:anti-sigma regulatory factor (Ser/Thr protein kinase)